MATEDLIMERLLRVILGHGEVTRHDLLEKAKVKIWRYNQIKSFFEDKYQDKIKYDKSARTWYSLEYLITRETSTNSLPQKTIEIGITQEK